MPTQRRFHPAGAAQGKSAGVRARGARPRGPALATLAASGALAFGVLACGGPPPIVACEAHAGVTPVCGFHNPEDIALAPGGRWLILSEAPRGDEPGELAGYRPDDGARRTLWDGASEPVSPSVAGCPGAPEPGALVPHGIDLADDGRTLFVVNHGGRETVEVFDLRRDERGPTLVWRDCVRMPEESMMNDVAALPDARQESGFVATRMMSPGIAGMMALSFGRSSGEVWLWTPVRGLQEVPNTTARGPNGIEVSADGGTLFFSEWAARRLVRIGIDGNGRRAVDLGFNPDNLTWAPDGRLLVAGQIASPIEATACFDVREGTCGLPSAVAAVDPATLEVERLWTADPATVAGGVSVALEHDGRIWLGTFGGDRVAWFSAPRTPARRAAAGSAERR